MPTTMRPMAEPAAEEGTEARDDGCGAGWGVAPGAGSQHGEEEVATLGEVVGWSCPGFVDGFGLSGSPPHPGVMLEFVAHG
jgi:hypothetical protein